MQAARQANIARALEDWRQAKTSIEQAGDFAPPSSVFSAVATKLDLVLAQSDQGRAQGAKPDRSGFQIPDQSVDARRFGRGFPAASAGDRRLDKPPDLGLAKAHKPVATDAQPSVQGFLKTCRQGMGVQSAARRKGGGSRSFLEPPPRAGAGIGLIFIGRVIDPALADQGQSIAQSCASKAKQGPEQEEVPAFGPDWRGRPAAKVAYRQALVGAHGGVFRLIVGGVSHQDHARARCARRFGEQAVTGEARLFGKARCGFFSAPYEGQGLGAEARGLLQGARGPVSALRIETVIDGEGEDFSAMPAPIGERGDQEKKAVAAAGKGDGQGMIRTRIKPCLHFRQRGGQSRMPNLGEAALRLLRMMTVFTHHRQLSGREGPHRPS